KPGPGMRRHGDSKRATQIASATEGHFRGNGAGIPVVRSALIAAVRNTRETAGMGPRVGAHLNYVRLLVFGSPPLGRIIARSGLLEVVLEQNLCRTVSGFILSRLI